jgi:hypothetical protein
MEGRERGGEGEGKIGGERMGECVRKSYRTCVNEWVKAYACDEVRVCVRVCK